MNETAVDRLFLEFRDASSILRTAGELSLSSAMDVSSRKAVLLAAASYFERRLSAAVLAFCQEVSGNNRLVPALVLNKAITRQYHTWFDWNGSTATTFFSLFGPEFKKHMQDLLKKDEALRSAIRAFIEMGRDRNRLVHEDYSTFTLEETIQEIYELLAERPERGGFFLGRAGRTRLRQVRRGRSCS